MFESELLSCLKSTTYGFERGDNVIRTAAQNAGIDTYEAPCLVNNMICYERDIRKYNRTAADTGSASNDAPQDRCVQAWQQSTKFRKMCLQKSDKYIIKKFAEFFNEAAGKYMRKGVCDAVIVPKEKLIRRVCRQMRIPRAVFYTLFENPDCRYYDDGCGSFIVNYDRITTWCNT